MAESPIRIARQLYEQLFDEPLRQQFAALNAYLDEDGSVCVLAQKGVGGLVSEFGLSEQQARAFQQRINGLATQVMRRFIESRLTNEDESVPSTEGMSNGPTYALLFNPRYDELCPANAIEAIHSAAAYLVVLMHWAQQRLGVADDKALPLTGRRPDLEKLLIDNMTINGTVTSVEVVTRVMETFIENTSGATQNIDKDLSEQFFPNNLPFHTPWETLDYVLRNAAESVGSVVRLCDPLFPYFIRPLHRSVEYDKAFTQAVRLSPAQRKILTEDRGPLGEFYPRYFGLAPVLGGNLRHVSVFIERTKLDFQGVEALLSLENSSTTLSENVQDSGVPVSGVDAGSVYIHEGRNPPISIEYANTGFPELFNFFKNASHDHYDRMNRKLRLDRWLELPSHEVDAVIVAAMEAERSRVKLAYLMTENTVRALGLFQELREQYACTAEEFAAFFWRISIFGRGTEKSQFDRIFNEHLRFSAPFKIDGGAFAIIPVAPADLLTVNQLCSGLGIDMETYFYLAHFVADAHGVAELARSLPIISSFYRMARLPRLLGITPIQAILLLGVIGGEAWVTPLFGTPCIATQRNEATPDTLSVIHALMECVRWCRDADLPVHWVIEQVTPITQSSLPSDAQRELFSQLQVQLPPVLLTEQALTMVGVPALSNNRQWMNELRALVDEQGLVVHFTQTPQQSFEFHAREVIDRVVKAAIGGIDDAARRVIVEKILVVVLRTEAGQRNVVQGSLGAYARLALEQVLPVLTWSGSTVYGLLAEVLARWPADSDRASRRQTNEEPGDPFLSVLAEFSRRSNVAATLQLSADFLRHFIQYGYKRWFALETVQAFSISTLYDLTVYKRAVTMTGQPEEKLLDYLARVNALPSLVGDGKLLVQERAAKLLAELFAWSVRDVRACADHVNPEQGFIRTLAQLDALTRIRQLALQTGLSAEILLDMARLPADSTYEAYASLAEQVSASLSDRTDPTLADDIVAIGLDVLVTSTVSATQLIANHPTNFVVYTVQVLDRASEPLKSANVTWRSGLGRFEVPMSVTDNDGKATVKFYPGSQMGTAVPSFHLDLGNDRVAPAVEIGPDRTSLNITTDNIFPEPPGPVLLGTPVTYRATVVDDYENRFVGEQVTWNLSSLPQPVVHSRTNSKGVTELTFTSGDAGQVNVEATIGSVSLSFRPIEFVEALPQPE